MQVYNTILSGRDGVIFICFLGFRQSQQFYYLIYLLLMYYRNGWDHRLMSWCLPRTIHIICCFVYMYCIIACNICIVRNKLTYLLTHQAALLLQILLSRL